MSTPIIKIKVTPKSVVKGRMDVRFPANIQTENFLTITRANGAYTFDIDYTVLTPGPISDPTTAIIAILDQTAGIYKEVTLASLLTSGLDADLQAIAALTGTGILARTADGIWALRTLTAPAAGITITNPAGVAGNPTLVLANDLAAVEGLAANGIAARTATDTWTVRTITAGASIGVTNGDGVSGNPTIAVTDAELVALAGLTSAADKLPYFTGSGTASLADFSAFARTLIDDTTQGAMQTTLGLVPGTNVQAFDSDLAALAANSGTGLWSVTGAGTGSVRTLIAPAAGITVANGGGVAGNPTLALADDLNALEGLSGTGIARRTGTSTWSTGTAISNAELAAMNAFTFKGNNTSGSATPTDVDIAALTAKASPASTDLVIISDQAASGAWKKVTVSALSSAGSVASIAGNTGAFTLAGGITNSTNQIQLDGNYTGFAIPNCTLAASVTSNILTVALKDNTGADPSATSPVYINYRNVTAATGTTALVAQTAALSITTNATGATLGTANTVPFRIWVVVFNNAGTNVLGLFQSVTGGSTPTAIAPLNQAAVASSTPISGTATAAGTFYTPNGTTVTSKSFRILGYIDYASGLTTAGTYASGPTTIQTFGPGIKKPGDIMQSVVGSTTSATTTTSSTPQTTGCSLSMVPTSAPNLVSVFVTGSLSPQVTGHFGFIQIYRGSTALGFNGKSYGGGGPQISQAAIRVLDAPGTTSSTTYAVKLNNDDNASSCIFPYVAVGGGGAFIFADEIMV